MKKLKKVLALGMAGAMALSLAACGGDTSTSGSTSTGTGETSTADGEVVTLKWVMVGNGMPSNYDAWLAQVNPYLEEKIGVNIDVEVVGWGDWDQRRNVIVNTAGEYDILFTPTPTTWAWAPSWTSPTCCLRSLPTCGRPSPRTSGMPAA